MSMSYPDTSFLEEAIAVIRSHSSRYWPSAPPSQPEVTTPPAPFAAPLPSPEGESRRRKGKKGARAKTHSSAHPQPADEALSPPPDSWAPPDPSPGHSDTTWLLAAPSIARRGVAQPPSES
ncbi:hypothetical protein BOTBODRAFT_46608 [Botryobasidium botryosum FD-172 SS1]|uniref:Uncharacterized protein n=1 Tax=Botryobasidium botryosum (strain FD-172 SS1) TaxID=930990 RepID=A0A067MGS0_BOTB1|nr:hypothetical protein BOTBODRAFT_46608 [Botryobasidium botryosum FD-172 SS1]